MHVLPADISEVRTSSV